MRDNGTTNLSSSSENDILDILIIGAGISGIGAGCYLTREHPEKQWAIVEMRNDLGGTWDLFRYPGVRSDSDLYTFAYDFKPWTGEKALADADAIMTYLREAVSEYNINEKIRYNHKVLSADWSSEKSLWTVKLWRSDTDSETTIKSRWIFSASGYYNYDKGYTPHFEGRENFKGDIIHPQFWPEGYDYENKNVIVIGSGATAVTLVPAMADKTAHITMLQRTPTYIMPVPENDWLGNWLRKWLPLKWAYAITRRKNVLQQRWFWLFCQRFPNAARALIKSANKKSLPENYPVDEHFTPPYNPWDQRLCAVPDADLFKAISKGKASVVTAQLKRFTKNCIELEDGRTLPADTIITATGLNVQLLGGATLTIDGQELDASERLVYKGMMLDNIPNLAFAVGYTNSSWTLKIGLLCEHFCRILSHMDKHNYTVCKPVRPSDNIETRPLMEFGAGYVQRSLHLMPRQGTEAPWAMTWNYFEDAKLLRKGPVENSNLKFTKTTNKAIPA